MFKKYTKSLFEKEMINHEDGIEENMEPSGRQQEENIGLPGRQQEWPMPPKQMGFQQQGMYPYAQASVDKEALSSQEITQRSFDVRSERNSRSMSSMSQPPFSKQEYHSTYSEDEFSVDDQWNEKISALPTSPSFHPDDFDEEPETTLGEGVSFKGQLNFKRYLRVDGTFEGELISDGKLIVGPSGIVKSDVKMHEVIVEGYIEGNVTVKERLELRGEAQIHGDITAKSLSVDDGVTIIGHVCVKPDVSFEADIVTDKKNDTKKK